MANIERPTEEQIIEQGDGVYSGIAHYGAWAVQKALQGATYWEVWNSATGGPREFFDTFAEAAEHAEAQGSARFAHLRAWTVETSPMRAYMR